MFAGESMVAMSATAWLSAYITHDKGHTGCAASKGTFLYPFLLLFLQDMAV